MSGNSALQAPADGADREQALAVGLRGRASSARGTSAGTCRSGSRRRRSSCADSMRARLTKVPLRLPWSSIVKLAVRATITACLRETVTSSRKMSQSGERPIVVRSRCGSKVSPARPPPERTTRAGPSTGISLERGEPRSSRSSSVNVMSSRRLARCAQQRAARRRSSRPPGSGSRTRDSRHGSCRRRGGGAPCRRGSRSARRRRPGRGRSCRPIFCSRATSSARRMSICPCRMPPPVRDLLLLRASRRSALRSLVGEGARDRAAVPRQPFARKGQAPALAARRGQPELELLRRAPASPWIDLLDDLAELGVRAPRCLVGLALRVEVHTGSSGSGSTCAQPRSSNTLIPSGRSTLAARRAAR